MLPPLLLATVLLLLTALWLLRPKTDAPGPPTVPLLGNALLFTRTPITIGLFADLQRRYGNTFRLYVGTRLVVFVTDPRDAQQVVGSQSNITRDSYGRNMLRPFFGDGLLTADDESWTTHRRLLQPAFKPETLQLFLGTFNRGARLAADYLSTLSDGGPRDCYAPLFTAMLDMAIENVLSVTLDEMEPSPKKRAEFAQLMLRAMDILQEVLFKPWLNVGWVRPLTQQGREHRRIIEVFHGYQQRLLDLKLAEARGDLPRRRACIIDELIGPGTRLRLPLKEITDEGHTLVITASETTSNTLGFALCLLGLHPEWQQAVHQELDSVFGGNVDRPVTAEDLAELRLTDRVIKETMRLFPPVYAADRQLPRDVQLHCGYRLPRGCVVYFVPFLTHRLPELYPDPARFDPDHFLPESSEGRSAFDFAPFGGGARICIGKRYAAVQMKTVLATVLRRFAVLPGTTRGELEELRVSIVMRPVTGFRVKLEPRNTADGLHNSPNLD